MEFELILRRVGSSAGFIIPTIFLNKKYSSAFSNSSLSIGKKYKVVIEEVIE
jgi:hypothetical protein